MPSVPSLGPRGEGWLALQVLMLVLVAAAGALAPRSAGSAGLEWTTAVGLPLLLVGGVITLWGVVDLRAGRSVSPLPHPVPESALVKTGAYSRIRHPIYAGLILFAAGWSVLQASVPALVASAGLALVLDLKRRREEARLDEHFPAYAAYRARTKAFVPFVY